VIGGTARSFSQSGLPENSSASKPIVPASSASCSVADTLGSTPLTLRKTGSIRAARRSGGMLKPTSTATGTQASNCRIVKSGSSKRPCSSSVCQISVAAASAAAHSHSDARCMASANTAIKQRMKNTGSAMVCRLSAAPNGAIPIEGISGPYT
jgi:hypothetical protein